MSFRARRIVLMGFSLAVSCATGTSSSAQVTPPDSADVAASVPDSLLTPPELAPDDSTSHLPPEEPEPPAQPIGWFTPSPGDPAVTRQMARTRFVHPSHALAEHRQSFLYDTGLPGWPIGWSTAGLAPSTGRTRLNGLRFEDPFTGIGLTELLPVELLEPIRISWAPRYWGPAVLGDIRPLPGRPPLTEIRYAQGANKLAFVSVFHSQERNREIFGRPTRVGFLFRYGGRGSTGAYPSSTYKLRSAYLRVVLERSRWLAELAYLRTRSDRGGQAGVLPRPGQGFDSVYETFSPTVRLPGAEHRIDRHDLSLRLRLRWRAGLPPLAVSSLLAPQKNVFSLSGDKLDAHATQWNVVAVQPLGRWGAHRLELSTEYFRNHIGRSTAFSDSNSVSLNTWSAGLMDSTGVLRGSLTAQAAILGLESSVRPGFLVSFSHPLGPTVWNIRGAQTYRPASHVDRFGFGESLGGDPGARGTFIRYAETSIGFAYKPGRAEIGLFHSTVLDPVEYVASSSILEEDATLVSASRSDRPMRSYGVSAWLAFRSRARRGLYGSMHAALVHLSGGPPGVVEYTSSAIPEWTGESRMGIRMRLFNGDLALDAFLRARGWTQFRSRTIHPQSGLFVLPAGNDLRIGPSGTLDAYMEGQIRTATVFVQIENVLAGSLYPGTIVVPVYPLPSVQFRLGVFWPLLN